ncbi:MAG TPA: hypothetical protein DD435_08655 [Cyanobacteria bacterium UBA8530]|nr:hypothetical protein [Cyanobacteria bacterium UBA8530]
MPVNERLFPLILVSLLFLASCKSSAPSVPVKGTVRDSKGLPIAGAVISDGSVSTLTDDSGSFNLLAYSRNLMIHKPRFEPLEFQADTVNDLTLVSRTSPLTIAWDLRWGGGQTEGVRKHLLDNKVKVMPFKEGIPTAEILVLSCPSVFSSEASLEARNWVRKGGTLVLLGEWGGYPFFDQDGANRLLEGTGIRFSGTTVREYDPKDQQRPEWIPIASFTSRALVAHLAKGPTLFTAGSLDLTTPAQTLAQTGEKSFRISSYSQGPQVVAAASPFGYGKFVVWSDNSFITDTDSLGNGTPDWKYADNAATAFNCFGF